MTCKVCKYSIEEAPQGEIVKRRFCRWGPPHLTMLPAQGGSMMLVSAPPVHDEYECAQFKERTADPNVN